MKQFKKIFTVLLLLCSSTLIVSGCKEKKEKENNQGNTPTFSSTLPKGKAIKSIPVPPEGKRWVVNEQYSDEFNGTELDKSKWYHKHRSGWIGREPAKFLSENLKVEDGYLKFWGSVIGEEVDSIKSGDFFLGCATITSVMQDAHFGYYESRYKASKTTLGAGFWLSSYNAPAVNDGGYNLPAQKKVLKVNADTEIKVNWESIPESSQKNGLYERLDNNTVKVVGAKRLEMLQGKDFHTNGGGQAYQINANSTFRQELDVNETVGALDRNESWASQQFVHNMSSNVHLWFWPNNDITTGTNNTDMVDVRIEETKQSLTPGVVGDIKDLENAVLSSDDYKTYGCWWRDESSATFYLDNNAVNGTSTFQDRKGGSQFVLSEPMSVNMTSESYYIHNFAPSYFIWYPELDKLQTPELSTTQYDWIRSYYLVNDTSANPEDAKEMVMFETQVYISEKPFIVSNGTLAVKIQYTTDVDQKLLLVVYDEDGNIISESSTDAFAGYANTSINVEIKGEGKQSIAAYIGNSKDLAKDYKSGDSFSFTAK